MSFHTAYSMKKRMAKGGSVAADKDYNNVRGVNQSVFPASGTKHENKGNQGTSEAGMYVRGPDHLKSQEKSKEKHREMLKEMSSMKKPMLPMAEGGDIGGDDIVIRVMKSRGGMIANDTPPEADFEPNDFDDLAMRDELEFSYDGDNSGDHLGDEQEDEDRKDIVSRIMKSRAKKDKNPRPA